MNNPMYDAAFDAAIECFAEGGSHRDAQLLAAIAASSNADWTQVDDIMALVVEATQHASEHWDSCVRGADALCKS